MATRIYEPLVITDEDKPIVQIEAAAYATMLAYVQLCDVEIAWFGQVTKSKQDKHDVYTISEVYLFPQIQTAATVNVDEEEYALWFAKLSQEKGQSFVKGHRFHGHSHVNMGVSPSGTDSGYRRLLTQPFTHGEDDWYIFMICNKRGEYSVELYDYSKSILYETHDVIVRMVREGTALPPIDIASIKKDVDECKRKATPVYSSTSYRSTSSPATWQQRQEPYSWNRVLEDEEGAVDQLQLNLNAADTICDSCLLEDVQSACDRRVRQFQYPDCYVTANARSSEDF